MSAYPVSDGRFFPKVAKDFDQWKKKLPSLWWQQRNTVKACQLAQLCIFITDGSSHDRNASRIWSIIKIESSNSYPFTSILLSFPSWGFDTQVILGDREWGWDRPLFFTFCDFRWGVPEVSPGGTSLCWRWGQTGYGWFAFDAYIQLNFVWLFCLLSSFSCLMFSHIHCVIFCQDNKKTVQVWTRLSDVIWFWPSHKFVFACQHPLELVFTWSWQ